MSELTVVQRLLVITVLAGAIGYERERHGRAAGFRTHILVGVGACLIMLTGIHLMAVVGDQAPFDPTRMAAQVVSGIGFLGAGTILRFGASVRGLTTAASLWAVGGIGLAVGAGFLWGAVVATLIVVVTLFGFSPLERAMRREMYRSLVLVTRASGDELVKIRRILADYEVEVRNFDVKPSEIPGLSSVAFQVKLLKGRDQEEILQHLLRLEEVKQARWVT